MPQLIDAIVAGHKKRTIAVVNGLELCGLEKSPTEEKKVEMRKMVERRQEGNLRDLISRVDGKSQVVMTVIIAAAIVSAYCTL